jgi:hypothetical protein
LPRADEWWTPERLRPPPRRPHGQAGLEIGAGEELAERGGRKGRACLGSGNRRQRHGGRLGRLRQMRIHLQDPALAPDLIDFLRSRIDAVVGRVEADVVEVSLLGSLAADAMRLELELRLRAWESGRQAKAEISD